MNARDWTAELTAYIDGELSESDAKALEAELARNAELKAMEQNLRRTVALMGQVPQVEPSAALRRAGLNGLDTPSTFGERLRAWLSPGKLVPLAALATAAVVTVLVVRGQPKVVPANVPVEDDQMLIAQNMDVLEDLDVLGLDSPDDLDVVANLNELEVQ